MRRVFIITPVLNEKENISTLVEGWRFAVSAMPEFAFQFILVDDGSTDGTAEEVLKCSDSLDVEILKHHINQGPGAAFASGFASLKGKLRAEDIVVTIEGDNTSRIETLRIMLGRIVRENVDVALASPLSYGGGVANTKWHRRMLGHMSSALSKIILDIRGINTFTSFFRAYQGHVILELQKMYGEKILEFTGFECMIELLKKMVINKYSISEVPMFLDTSLRKGKSKLKIFKTAIKYFAVFYRARQWKKTN